MLLLSPGNLFWEAYVFHPTLAVYMTDHCLAYTDTWNGVKGFGKTSSTHLNCSVAAFFFDNVVRCKEWLWYTTRPGLLNVWWAINAITDSWATMSWEGGEVKLLFAEMQIAAHDKSSASCSLCHTMMPPSDFGDLSLCACSDHPSPTVLLSGNNRDKLHCQMRQLALLSTLPKTPKWLFPLTVGLPAGGESPRSTKA